MIPLIIVLICYLAIGLLIVSIYSWYNPITIDYNKNSYLHDDEFEVYMHIYWGILLWPLIIIAFIFGVIIILFNKLISKLVKIKRVSDER